MLLTRKFVSSANDSRPNFPNNNGALWNLDCVRDIVGARVEVYNLVTSIFVQHVLNRLGIVTLAVTLGTFRLDRYKLYTH